MKLIHRKDIIASALDRWAEQYDTYGRPDKKVITQKLFALRDAGNLTAETITAAIGNNSWTSNTCDECNRDCETLVHIGDEPDYDLKWQDLCVDCLKAAVSMIAGAA